MSSSCETSTDQATCGSTSEACTPPPSYPIYQATSSENQNASRSTCPAEKVEKVVEKVAKTEIVEKAEIVHKEIIQKAERVAEKIEKCKSKASSTNSQSVQKDNNINDMVAKVTIETPSGSTTKYYLLYRDRCFSPGSLLVGALGGLGVGFYTKSFFEQWKKTPNKTLTQNLPFVGKMTKIPEVRLSFTINGKAVSIPLLFGKTVWFRMGSRAVLSSILYSALECQLQGSWYRRSYLDCGLAGAVSGAVFGLRGIPGGYIGSGIGAAGFGAFAIISRFLFL